MGNAEGDTCPLYKIIQSTGEAKCSRANSGHCTRSESTGRGNWSLKLCFPEDPPFEWEENIGALEANGEVEGGRVLSGRDLG